MAVPAAGWQTSQGAGKVRSAYMPIQAGTETSEIMQITIIHADNAHVHKAGCADIKRRERKSRHFLSEYSLTVESQREAALDAWSDFVAEESMTEDDAIAYTYFYPCCDELPE